jgi:hypothetical protein
VDTSCEVSQGPRPRAFVSTRMRRGKLLFNALPEGEAARAVRVSGRAELAGALLQARSVIV